MTSFDYNYQKPSLFPFLMLIRAIPQLRFQNITNKAEKNERNWRRRQRQRTKLLLLRFLIGWLYCLCHLWLVLVLRHSVENRANGGNITTLTIEGGCCQESALEMEESIDILVTTWRRFSTRTVKVVLRDWARRKEGSRSQNNFLG